MKIKFLISRSLDAPKYYNLEVSEKREDPFGGVYDHILTLRSSKTIKSLEKEASTILEVLRTRNIEWEVEV